jgi:hypothetical protein
MDVNRISGYIPGKIVFFLMQVSLQLMVFCVCVILLPCFVYALPQLMALQGMHSHAFAAHASGCSADCASVMPPECSQAAGAPEDRGGRLFM